MYPVVLLYINFFVLFLSQHNNYQKLIHQWTRYYKWDVNEFFIIVVFKQEQNEEIYL
jgi:hypothetical protein